MSDFVIGRRQLYILPTRIGWYFSMILIALFAIAIKFDNQAAFMMLFILTSVGVIAMLYTHNNVIGLKIDTQPAMPVFMGETANFPVSVINSSGVNREAVWLLCDGYHQLLQIPADAQRRLDLKLPTVRRGYLVCPEINLSSQFPVGLFFCWSKRFPSSQRCLVYPQPLDLLAFPEGGDSGARQTGNVRLNSSNEDYNGMKAYQAGDRLRDIHWPSLAKTHKLVTVQYQNQTSSSVNLCWSDLPSNLSTEDRLSQLCHWVMQAEQAGIRYQLDMPNHTVEYGSGANHYHQCLSVLALWGLDDERRAVPEAPGKD